MKYKVTFFESVFKERVVIVDADDIVDARNVVICGSRNLTEKELLSLETTKVKDIERIVVTIELKEEK